MLHCVCILICGRQTCRIVSAMQQQNDSILSTQTKSIVVATSIFYFLIEIAAVDIPRKMFNFKLSNNAVIELERQSLSLYCIHFE